MQTYVVLMKLTGQGAKEIKDGPQRTKEGIKGVEAMGGKVKDFFLTMGDYDYVAIGEFPDDETAAAFLLSLGSLGYVKTTTLKAFSVEEYANIVKKIP
jgi:uncharacterized protein with GYD domain